MDLQIASHQAMYLSGTYAIASVYLLVRHRGLHRSSPMISIRNYDA
jgi:hypothetical protein